MPGAVDEGRPEAGVGDQVARDGIELTCRDPRTDGLAGGGLRLAQHAIQLGEVGRRRTDEDGPRRVGAVAVSRAADVEHHGVTGLDHPITGFVVRAGAVRPGADDGEVRAVMAGRQQQVANARADLGLGASGEPFGANGVHGLVGGSRRRPQSVDLGRALDPAQGGERWARGDELHRVEDRLQPEDEASPHLILDPDPSDVRVEDGAHELEGIVGLVPRHKLDLIGQRAERMPRQRCLERGQDERRLGIDLNDQAGQALERGGPVAEQVRVVGRWRDEQRVDPSLARLAGHGRQATGQDGRVEAAHGSGENRHRASLAE